MICGGRPAATNLNSRVAWGKTPRNSQVVASVGAPSASARSHDRRAIAPTVCDTRELEATIGSGGNWRDGDSPRDVHAPTMAENESASGPRADILGRSRKYCAERAKHTRRRNPLASSRRLLGHGVDDIVAVVIEQTQPWLAPRRISVWASLTHQEHIRSGLVERFGPLAWLAGVDI